MIVNLSQRSEIAKQKFQSPGFIVINTAALKDFAIYILYRVIKIHVAMIIINKVNSHKKSWKRLPCCVYEISVQFTQLLIILKVVLSLDNTFFFLFDRGLRDCREFN